MAGLNVLDAAAASSGTASSPAALRWLEQTPAQQQLHADQSSRVRLARLVGHTCTSASSLVPHPTHANEFFYTTGSVVVQYDQRAHAQRRFYTGRRGHELACLALTSDGTILAAGESGKHAAILLFDTVTTKRTALILGHASTIKLLKFSPLQDYLAVVTDAPTSNADAAAVAMPAAPSPVGDDTPAPSATRSTLTLWRVSDRTMVWTHSFSEADFGLPENRPEPETDKQKERAKQAAKLAAGGHKEGLIHSLDWSCDNTYLVLAGYRFLHYYYLRSPTSLTPFESHAWYRQPLLALERAEATWDELKLDPEKRKPVEVELVSIACGTGVLAHWAYGITSAGVLCAFMDRTKAKKEVTTSSGSSNVPRWELDRWVDLRLPGASCLTLRGETLVTCGAEAKVRVVEASTLDCHHTYATPKPAHTQLYPTRADAKGRPVQVGPATLLVALSCDAATVTTVYADRTLCVFRVPGAKEPRHLKLEPTHQVCVHAGAVYDLDLLVVTNKANVQRAIEDVDSDSDDDTQSDAAARAKYPDGSFVTCSADHTMRVWNVAEPMTDKQCLGVIAVPAPAASDVPPGGVPVPSGIRCLKFIPSSTASASSASATAASSGSAPLSSYPHGLLASGDQLGNVRLHNLVDLAQIVAMEAHDREVRTLDFHQQRVSVTGAPNTPSNLPLLVSGSRDHMVHLHNVHVPLTPQSLTPPSVHTSAVTQVRLATLPASTPAETDHLLLISGGLDKQLSIRRIVPDSAVPLPPGSIDLDVAPGDETPLRFPASNVIDLALHPSRKFLAVLCNNTEKKSQAAAAQQHGGGRAVSMASKPVNCIVRMVDLATRRETRQYSIQTLGNGEPTRMALDPSGLLLAIAFTDKSVLLLDWYSGAVLTSFYAHTQGVTALKFTHDCRQLLTVAGDGLICVWTLEKEYVQAMQQRKAELQRATARSLEKKKVAAPIAVAPPAKARHKSTAMNYLDTDSDEDEEEVQEEGAEETAKVEPTADKSNDAAASAAPASAAAAAPPAGLVLPPLLPHNGEVQIGRRSSLSGLQKVLPAWARSTVVSPEAGAGGAGGFEESASGALPAINGSRSRWAQRVEVDARGVPQANIADAGKIYGTMGTIGVGTLLLDNVNNDGKSAASSSAAASPTTEGREQEIEELIDIEVEGEADDEDEPEDDSSNEDSTTAAASTGAPSSTTGATSSSDNANMMRSSMTSQFFKKLRDEGALPSLPNATTSQSTASSSVKHGGGRGLGLPSSFVEREAKTTHETEQVRHQLRMLGVLDGPSSGAQPAHSSHLAVSAAPLPAISPQVSTVLSSSSADHAAAEGAASIAAASSSNVSSTSSSFATPPLASSLSPDSITRSLPGVHTSLAALPPNAQDLRMHRQTIEAFQASLQNLLVAFGQVKQAQVAARPQTAIPLGANARASAADGAAAVPSVSVSFAPSISSNAPVSPSVVVIPVLSPNEIATSRSYHHLAPPNATFVAAPLSSNMHGSVSFPSVNESVLGCAATDDAASSSTTDLDTLASVYEEQLLTMQAVLAQVLPATAVAPPNTTPPPVATSSTTAPPAGLAPLVMPSHDARVPQSSPSPTTFVSHHYPGSPLVAEGPSFAGAASAVGAALNPLEQTQSQFLQSMEFGMDRMSDRLAELVLAKIESKIANTQQLSTTQQLALGMTFSQPSVPSAAQSNSQVPASER